MKQEIDNNAMWAAFRQELALQGELHVVAAIDNALNNLGFTIEETSKIVPIPLKQGEQKLCVNDNTKEMFIKALERVEEQNNKGYKLTDCDKNSWWEDFKAYTSCTIVQKPADKSKIKPKFKTGDRVIGIVSGMPYFITEVCDDHYNTESGCIIMFCSQDNFELYEQKPAEWSEEDETVLNNLIYALANDRIGNNRDEYVDWLKSLRTQTTWKPSEEQMLALEAKLTMPPQSPAMTSALIELYEQLKKLKG